MHQHARATPPLTGRYRGCEGSDPRHHELRLVERPEAGCRQEHRHCGRCAGLGEKAFDLLFEKHGLPPIAT